MLGQKIEVLSQPVGKFQPRLSVQIVRGIWCTDGIHELGAVR